jgi:hypothetical protein
MQVQGHSIKGSWWELDFSPAEREFNLSVGFSPGFPIPALKRMIEGELFPER